MRARLSIGTTTSRNPWRRLAPAGLALLCSCATGILPAGPDTYTLTERRGLLVGGVDAAQTTALAEANAFCMGQGRQFVPATTEKVPSPGGPTTTFVVTLWRSPGSSELSRAVGAGCRDRAAPALNHAPARYFPSLFPPTLVV